MLSFDHVSFNYRPADAAENPAISDISFAVHPPEFVAVVGHNGSGKSTLLRLLAALQFPCGGAVTVDGITSAPSTRWDIRERVAVVFQDPDSQLVQSKVEDDIAFGPENLGIPRPELRVRVDESADVLGITSLLAATVDDLSSGSKQRVAIAGALAMRPRYLVLDEATSFMPALAATQFLSALRALHMRTGVTIFHITHSMEEAVFFDRVLVLAEGRLVADGSPSAIFRRPGVLREAGLDLPVAVDFAQRLGRAGVPTPDGLLTVDDVVSSLAGVPLRGGR